MKILFCLIFTCPLLFFLATVVFAVSSTLGSTAQGVATDSYDSNYMNGSKATMGNDSGTVTQMSVYVAKIDSAATYRKYQLAIYTDNSGNPGTLVAKSATSTLIANSWNTVAVNANLQADTTYWLMYNTNGRSGSDNNMKYNTGPANSGAWSTSKTTFGTWPTNFGPATKWNGVFSLYATYTPASSDTQAPIVSISSPTNGTTVLNDQTLAADATDNVAVANVQFMVDSVNVGSPDTISPYTTRWDTLTVANGNHSISAKATDTSGNETTSMPIPINVQNTNPPKLTTVEPVSGQQIEGTTITIRYQKDGDLTIADHVHYQIDNNPEIKDYDFDGVFTPVTVLTGTHTVKGYMVRSDHAKIAGTDAPNVTFTNTNSADTQPPVVSITSPEDGATVSGTISVVADASDNIEVATVQFKLDGNNLGPEDQTPPYAISWNSTSINNGSHTLTANAKDTSNNQATSSDVVVNINNTDPRAQVGEWSPLVNWPLVAVHGALLPTGKIILWDGWEYGTTTAKVWDPQANIFTAANVNSQLFCSAHSQLSDGRLMVTGGHNGGEIGIKDTNVFNPPTNSWLRLADMNYARWYPTQTTLGDGRVISFSGQKTSGDFADIPEIYNPTNNTWSTLSVNTSSIHDADYPLNFLLPDGKIFTLGATHGAAGLLDVTNQTWANLSAPPQRFGSSAMYQPGKILYTGGGTSEGSAAKVESYITDRNQTNPTWRQVTSMANPRYAHNLIILPTGKVMAVGGVNLVNKNSSAGSLIPEIWDPASEIWTAMDQADDARGYHSIAMLLPDGRVLSAGGGRFGSAQNHFTAQIFSPPYLFNGSRPTIAQAPAFVNYASSITVDTQDAANISKVSFIPLASVTHTLDMNQKFLELPFTKNPNQLLVETPTNPNIAPPGYYMLFIINSNGVPSIAKIINLNYKDTQAPIITNVQSTNISSTSATISWNTNENANSQVEYGINTAYGATTSLDSTQATNHSQSLTNLSANMLYHYRVKSRDLAGNLAESDDFTFSTLSQSVQTITFDDLEGQDQTLTGQYPVGIIDWGSVANWWHSAPWRKFTTKSLTFNGAEISAATFSFITPKQFVKLDLFNGGASQATTTLSCPGMPNKQIILNPDQMLTAVATGWSGSCTPITITSSNGWDTNWDNLVIQ